MCAFKKLRSKFVETRRAFINDAADGGSDVGALICDERAPKVKIIEVIKVKNRKKELTVGSFQIVVHFKYGGRDVCLSRKKHQASH